MGFERRTEIHLNAKMNVCRSRRKPTPTSSSQALRLKSFRHTQNIAIESACTVFFAGWHGQLNVIQRENLHSSGQLRLREIRHGIGRLDELLQRRQDGWPLEQLAEKLDLFLKFGVRNRLKKFLCRRACGGIKFSDLRGGRAGNLQRLAFAGKLRHQTCCLRTSGVDATASEQKIPDETVAEVALEPRNSAKTRNQPETQFWKREARHFVRHDNVAGERKLEPPAETDTMNCRNGDEGRCIDRIGNSVAALHKIADSRVALFFRKRNRTAIQLAQIRSRGKSTLLRASDDTHRGLGFKCLHGSNELFQFAKQNRAYLIGGFAVERQIDDGVAPFPT